MRHGRNDGLISSRYRSAPARILAPLAVRLRTAGDQAVHLGDRRLDEFQRFGEIRESCLSSPSRTGSVSPAPIGAAEAAARLSIAITLENIGAQFLSSLVNPRC